MAAPTRVVVAVTAVTADTGIVLEPLIATAGAAVAAQVVIAAMGLMLV
jgi:hypothetical protein